MKQDTICIDDDHEALLFAIGCLVAALRARANNFDTRFSAGLWSIALLSGAFAIHHIKCAWYGTRVFMGAPDRLYDSLRAGDDAEQALATTFHNAMPVIAGLFLALGLAHLFASYLLARRQLRRFIFVWLAGLVIATAAVTIQLSLVWTLNGVPSEFFALLIQVLFVPALLVWSNGRHRTLNDPETRPD